MVPFNSLYLIKYILKLNFMAEMEQNAGGGGGSAITVLVTVVIVVIIGAAFYFGFVRGNWGNNDQNDGLNIDVTLPTGSGQEGGPAE